MTNEEFIKSVSLEGEIWKDVVGYEGKYYISNFGRVLTKSPTKGWVFLKGEQPNKFGHLRVGLYSHCKRSRIYIHQLVANHFIDNPFGYNEIDHIDCNTQNNHYSNLRWCTHKENVNNPITLSKYQYKNKGKYNNEKTSKPVVQIKNNIVINIFPSAREANRNGFSYSRICLCCKDNNKTHKGCNWYYLSEYENLINKSKNALPNPN